MNERKKEWKNGNMEIWKKKKERMNDCW